MSESTVGMRKEIRESEIRSKDIEPFLKDSDQKRRLDPNGCVYHDTTTHTRNSLLSYCINIALTRDNPLFKSEISQRSANQAFENVKLLLSYGADVGLEDANDSFIKYNALQHLCSSAIHGFSPRFFELLALLINKKSVNAQNSRKETPLGILCFGLRSYARSPEHFIPKNIVFDIEGFALAVRRLIDSNADVRIPSSCGDYNRLNAFMSPIEFLKDAHKLFNAWPPNTADFVEKMKKGILEIIQVLGAKAKELDAFDIAKKKSAGDSKSAAGSPPSAGDSKSPAEGQALDQQDQQTPPPLTSAFAAAREQAAAAGRGVGARGQAAAADGSRNKPSGVGSPQDRP